MWHVLFMIYRYVIICRYDIALVDNKVNKIEKTELVGTRSKLALHSVYIFMIKETMKKLSQNISFLT